MLIGISLLAHLRKQTNKQDWGDSLPIDVDSLSYQVKGKRACIGAPFIFQGLVWEDWFFFSFAPFPFVSIFSFFLLFFLLCAPLSLPLHPIVAFLLVWFFSFFSLLSKSYPRPGLSSFRKWQNLTSLLSWNHCWDIWGLQLCPEAKSNSLALCGFPLWQRKKAVLSELAIIPC